MLLTAKIKRFAFAAFFLAFVGVSSVFAQESAPDWDALFQRRDGWLGADGIYSIDLNDDAANVSDDVKNRETDAAPRTLFWFSDTLGGSTRADGTEFDRFQMTNHSFALLDGDAPNPAKIRFFWKRENAETNAASPDDKPRNLIAPNRWLQDGTVYRQRIWLSAILVGNAWKPERVDAVSIGRNVDGSPNFDDVRIDENAPLSFKTENAQVVFGAALTDDANDGFLYVFGYLDRFDAGSRKDLVVARVERERFDDFSAWRYFDGTSWTASVCDACKPDAALVENVSTEFSISRIPNGVGANAGKFLLVYTPGVIGDEIAFRVAPTPLGPFGPERVFYRSTVPAEFEPGVRCYNAKAHPIFGDSEKILVSYNVNRLGSLARRPGEYRPRFVWLRYATVDELEKSGDAKNSR